MIEPGAHRLVPKPRYRAWLVVLAASLPLSGACRSEPQLLFAQATRAVNADEFEAAVRLFREVVIAHPENRLSARALYELANIYHLRLRDSSAAHASLVKILSDYPESAVSVSAHRRLARLYEHELGYPEKALYHYRDVLAADVDVDTARETLLSLADCHYRLQQIDEAIDAYRRALELPYDPVADSAYLRLAALSRLRGDGEDALRRLQQLQLATEEPATRYEALHEQVEVLMELGRFSEARERLRAAQSVIPHAPRSDELQSRLHAAQLERQPLAEEDEALEELQKKIRWGAGRHSTRRP